MITIIDYGMGNLGSIQNMLKKCGTKSIISHKISDIEKAEKLILPGVGAFDNGIKNIEKFKLKAVLDKKVLRDKTPILGICLGMQLMTEKSEEGQLSGLGWVKGETIKFTDKNLKIPHMGWNFVKTQKKHQLVKDLPKESRFYFVHSYYVVLDREEEALMISNYGHDFVSAFQKDNIFGVQFHPEKSHKYGMKLLENFSQLGKGN